MRYKRKVNDLVATFEPCETNWLNEVGQSCRTHYPGYWQQFKEFIGISSGSEILRLRADDMLLRRDDPRRWRFEDLAKKFYQSLYEDREPPNPTGSDRQKFGAIQSFFSHQRMALEFKRGEVKQGLQTTVKYEYTLQDLEAAKKYGDITERWIFLGGKSLGQRINVFLDLKIDDIKPLLDEEPPAPIDIVTNKVAGLIAHPCVDRDALEVARDLIATRTDDNPFMLPGKGYKGKMTEQGVNKAIRRVADLAHQANPRLFRYKERKESLRFHGFRAFLTSAFQNAHVDKDLRDWIIGHKLSSTAKAYTTHARKQAYVDAEKYLLLPREISETLREEAEKMKKQAEEAGLKIEEMKKLIQLGMLRKPEELEKNGPKQERKVIPEDELENDLNHGWRFVSVLPSGRILIEREV